MGVPTGARYLSRVIDGELDYLMRAWLPTHNPPTRLGQAPKHHLADPAIARSTEQRPYARGRSALPKPSSSATRRSVDHACGVDALRRAHSCAACSSVRSASSAFGTTR